MINRTKQESLSAYVSRVLQEKRLTFQDVRRRSGGAIAESYVRGVVKGRADNLSVKKLQALARGLGVGEEELFRVARGLPPESSRQFGEREAVSYQLLVRLLYKALESPTLSQLLKEIAHLSADEQADALQLLRLLNARSERAERVAKVS